MKKTILLILFALFIMRGAFAQTPPPMQNGGEMFYLLPAGVEANIEDNQRKSKRKNLVVAGDKDKGYLAFFAATNAANGEELWATDGTPEGTYMVKDINPGPNGSDVSWLARFGDKVLFNAYSIDDWGYEMGTEVWISDGTSEGTYQVTQINVAYTGADPKGFVQINENQFVFSAKSLESGFVTSGAGGPQYWLYVADATSRPEYDDEGNVLNTGARLIAECDTRYPGGAYGSYHSAWVRVGRKVFFKADTKEKTVGEELWVTDGTAEGTYLVKDVNPRINTSSGLNDNSSIDHMVNLDNKKLYFAAYTFEYGTEPWASDGTPEGTYLIQDTNPDRNSTTGEGASGTPWDGGQYPYKGKVYARGYHTATTRGYGHSELGATNGERGDFRTFKINNLATTTASIVPSYPDPGVEFDGYYIFCAMAGTNATNWSAQGNYGGELHYTDGDTVLLQYDFRSGTGCNWVKELTVAGGSAYWWMEDNDNTDWHRKLFRLDRVKPTSGSNHSPVRVCQWTTTSADNITTLRQLNDDLIFGRAIGDGRAWLYSYHFRKPEYDAERDAFIDHDMNFGECDTLKANFSKTQHPTCANNDGELEISITGTPKSIVWSNGSTTASAGNNLPAGDYTVTVTGECNTVVLNFTLVVPTAPALNVAFTKTQHPTCANNDGELEISITGGTGTYSIAWSNGSTVASAGNNLPEETYTVTVTGECVEPVELSFTLAKPAGCEDGIGQISATQVVIYPNPASDTFNFNIEGEVLNVKIFDMTGRLIQTEIQPKNNTINISSLPKGIYNVLITGVNQNYTSTLSVE